MRDDLGVPALLFYLLVYVFMNLGAFVSIDALERTLGNDEIDSFSGAARTLPLASATLAVSALALAGFPPFGSFAAKSMLFGAALGGRQSWLAIVLALNTALSLYYYLRLIQPLYFGTQSASAKHNLPIALRFALIVFAAGSIITGVLPGAFVRFAAHSAQIIPK